MKLQITLSIFLFFSIVPQFCFAGKFSWKESTSLNQHVDLLWKDQKIARYVFEKMNPKDRERTYKPFHHIFQSNGADFLTKGPGGKYTHHRGIYFGFSKCSALDGN
ncbi:PmoA family protein, partial [Opitutales bacterium]|nr:PmoA family protein [Opitutales bacterium]